MMDGIMIDPVKRELIKNALRTICDNMIVLVIRTSRSVVVKNNLDFSSSILDASGEMVVQGLSLPAHLGATMPALKGCMDYFGDDIQEGDILCSNDPYAGASHLNDIFMFRPVYVARQRVAFLCLILHHTDMGGRVPGGNASDSTEIFQEGLRIPPSKIYERGKPNTTLLRIIANNVRVSDRVMGDVHSQMSSLLGGEREFRKLLERYDAPTLTAYIGDLIGYSEQLARANIRRLPNGVGEFVDWLDDDGMPDGPPVKIAVKVTIEDETITVDFTGTSRQTSGALNPNYWFTVSMAYAVLRTVMDVDLLTNAGFYRPISVIAPEGTFVNPRFPAPVGARGLGGYRVRTAVHGALAQILPDRMPACVGTSEFAVVFAGYQTEKPFLMLEFHNVAGAGGGPRRDGQDAGPYCLGNTANVPVEVIEAENPVRVTRYGFLPDTEGAGQYRGALGIVREYELLAESATVQLRSDRQKHPPYGLRGGQPGAAARVVMNPGRADERVLPSKFVMTMGRGDVLSGELPGSGGWGNAMKRDPAAVLEDVRQGKVSVERARSVYGVAIENDSAVRVEL
jgi:N-methylhydantoinase B